MRVSRASRAGRTSPVVGGEQDPVLGGGQLVVDAEVAEVEERVAHPRVLPVDDPDPGAVVDEVGVEQVVVAGPQLDRGGQQGASRSAARRPAARSYSGGIGTPRAMASAR